ncbi:MAG: acyl-CoA synthetase FdrA [Betaproteobacteria bacterium]|nr:acyl-CoA synthetase FdrA [Betaproteobacteria bacterium]
MPTGQRVIRNTYRDSVSLMQISARIGALAGIRKASLVMATEGNLALLREAKLIEDTVQAASSDLLMVLEGETDEAIERAFAQADEALTGEAASTSRGPPSEISPRSIQMALKNFSEGNLALISTPGEYAAAEALKALRLGLHVMLFSDNVSIADEIMLKREAAHRGLLVMGPDCGTAIVSGIPLGFANVVPRGPVGVAGASGTGMQQVTTLLGRAGIGVSHALGTGGRDLRAEIGGATMLQAIDELAADSETRVIVLISKPPAREVAAKVLDHAQATGKPVVACFLGAEADSTQRANVTSARTLEEAASMAAALAQGLPPSHAMPESPEFGMPSIKPGQKYLRALYSGGTFCYEATLLLSSVVPYVYSNTPAGLAHELADVWRGQAHALVDLGGDEFTRGRPHPMIDHRLRNERLLREAADPEVRAILFDVVLGYGSHADPSAEMLPALEEVKRIAQRAGRTVALVGFVCGTEQDPQGLSRQETALKNAGVILASSNAQAVRMVKRIIDA